MRVEYNTTILDIVYDESGQPFSIRYKSNPTKEGVVYYYVLNAQGDVIGLLNASGELVVEYKYDPWGKLLETIIGVDETDSKYAAYNNMGLRNPLRYRGYIYDRDTGLYYLQSRYYDPAIGRFINADTYTTTDADGILSSNMFAYCENNPVMGSDPTGEFWNVAVGALIGGAVSLASSYITAKITGESFKITDGISAFATGAVAGALTASGLPVGSITAINSAVSFSSSVASDYFSGREIDVGKAAMSGVISAIGSLVGGNGIRYKGDPYSVAKAAAKNAANKAKNAAKGYARKAANRAAKRYMKNFQDVYLDISYKQLGITLGTGAASTISLSIYGAIRR